MKAIILGLCLLAAITGSEAVICTTKLDCGSDECCYIKPLFEIASKRRQLSLLPPVTTHPKTGVCEKYRNAGDHCGPLETANGHCGCMSGMSCKWVPDSTPAAGRRGIVVPNEPGAFRCA